MHKSGYCYNNVYNNHTVSVFLITLVKFLYYTGVAEIGHFNLYTSLLATISSVYSLFSNQFNTMSLLLVTFSTLHFFMCIYSHKLFPLANNWLFRLFSL